MINVILTVDVEYDWGAATTDNLQFLTGLYNFLDDTNSRATLFVLGDIAEKVAEFGVSKNVEIASHSMSHANLREASEEELVNEIEGSKNLLEKTFETKVYGFRAPFFTPPDSLWDILKRVGYHYSSSLVAGYFPGRYNNKIESRPFDKEGIKEYPLQSFRFLHFPLGLSFMRLMYPVSKLMVPKKPYMFYYHTTELLRTWPGEEEPLGIRLMYGINRGRRARRLLYSFLEKHAPTKSIRDHLLSY
ncbi:hypothetical protein E2P64_00690 [Candidatus Bathyarchaeota archaeon]|nr:hypothetical protein E2P64_00690 [Candidatus Bathyarchaeota archaeon]